MEKLQPAKLGLLICMKGLPRSGKSTISRLLSKELGNAPIVNQDNIRLALHGRVYAKEAEIFVRGIVKVMVHSLFLSGHPIVIADETHYSRAKRDFMRDGPWETKFFEVETPKDICIQRAHHTGHIWLPPVIEEMCKRHEPLQDDEPRYLGYTYVHPNAVDKCEQCQKLDRDFLDKLIYHDNGHAGDPA